ncbi:hypothetical protein ACNOYE_17905 [Nannocystaceae bacterium ST9]
MISVRCLPFVGLATLGCTLVNPAFEGEGDDVADATGRDTGSEGKETGSSLGESGDGVETSASSSDGVDTNTDVDTSVSTSSSDGNDTSSSSDTLDTSSSSSSSSDTSSSSDGLDTSSSDGLNMLCPIVEPADSCFTCMQNNCCDEADVACFSGLDDACNCTLACLAENGLNCAVMCGAGQLVAEHAGAIFECGLSMCPNHCGG